MKNLFNLLSLDISYSDFLEKIKLTYINKIMSQLSHIKNTEKGKLRFFSNVYVARGESRICGWGSVSRRGVWGPLNVPQRVVGRGLVGGPGGGA
jgi:hypothetical protein